MFTDNIFQSIVGGFQTINGIELFFNKAQPNLKCNGASAPGVGGWGGQFVGFSTSKRQLLAKALICGFEFQVQKQIRIAPRFVPLQSIFVRKGFCCVWNWGMIHGWNPRSPPADAAASCVSAWDSSCVC